MSASTTPTTIPQRIRKLSDWLATFCLVLIVALPIAVACYWTWSNPDTLAIHANLPPDAIKSTLQTWQRLAGGAIAEIGVLVLLLGIWEARRFFRLLIQNRIFCAQAVRCLRAFAGWAMASAITAIAGNMAISVILTINNLPGMRHLALGVSSDHLLLFLFAGMVWVMADIIHEGQLLAEENSRFV